MGTALLFLKSRLGEWLIIATLIVGFGIYYHGQIVNTAKLEQKADDKVLLDKMTGERDKAIKTRDEYLAQYNKFVSDTAVAKQKQEEAQKVIDAEAKKSLAAANARAARIRTIIKTVDHYVTPIDDSHCTVPSGFVSLFNASAEADPSTAQFGISSGPGLSDGAPSFIVLSSVAQASANNNAEAVRRGQVILAWKVWYTHSKAAFDAAKAGVGHP